MASSIETKTKLRAIRRLSASFPDRTAEERLSQIEQIASGNLDASSVRRGTSPDLVERLKAGQASRSHGNAADRVPVERVEETKKKRRRFGGRDRMESGGIDRSADLNE